MQAVAQCGAVGHRIDSARRNRSPVGWCDRSSSHRCRSDRGHVSSVLPAGGPRPAPLALPSNGSFRSDSIMCSRCSTTSPFFSSSLSLIFIPSLFLFFALIWQAPANCQLSSLSFSYKPLKYLYKLGSLPIDKKILCIEINIITVCNKYLILYIFYLLSMNIVDRCT